MLKRKADSLKPKQLIEHNDCGSWCFGQRREVRQGLHAFVVVQGSTPVELSYPISLAVKFALGAMHC